MNNPKLNLISILIFFSGFSALVYEILWTRYLALIFGANMLAVSIVAATFMGGLAIGSYLFGRVADRTTRPLRLYAILEAGIALSAFAFPFCLDLANQLNFSLAQNFAGNKAMVTGSKIFLSVSLLVIPTACMGGTLPVLCRLFAHLETGRMIGRLYAINTGGAVLGSLSAAYLLIPSLGMNGASILAISANALIALSSYILDKYAEKKDLPTHQKAEHAPQHSPYFLLICVAVIGALALSYEILWTRVFLLFLGSTTYAFATVLSVYLLGLTAGAAIYTHYLSRLKNQKRLFQILIAGMGLSILVPLPIYDHMAYLFQGSQVAAKQQWLILSTYSFLNVSLVLLLPTMLSGALFPLAAYLYAPDTSKISSSVGKLLFWNTTGAVCGSILVSLLAIPALGILGSFRLLIGLNLTLALAVCWYYRQRIGYRVALLPAIALLIVAFIPFSWNQQLLNSGVYYYSQSIKEAGGLSKRLENHSPIIEQIEGLEATVAVYRNEFGQRYFRINGKTDGSSFTDIDTQILLGQLPMLFHPEARDILVIGLGTGITLGQVAGYPGTSNTCSEISPAVVKISEHFRPENHNVLDKQNVRLQLEDARSMLLTSTKRYDVIVSQPSNPWQAGNANLFTKEFYELVGQRLNKGGIFTQWLPIYDMPTEQLKTAINTLLQSFPETIAFGVGSDMILVSRVPGAGPISDITLAKQYSPSAQPLKQLAPDLKVLLETLYYGDDRTLEPFAAGAPLNTDNHPRLEFDRQMGEDRTWANFKALMTNKDEVGIKDLPFKIQ